MNHVYTMLGPQGLGNYEVDWNVGPSSATRVERPAHRTLIPGLIDIHIHGAYGIDFMSASMADMKVLCDKLAAEGYEGFLPTTVTASATEVSVALANLPDHPMILGFHLEGPFISPKYPGAQPPSAILEPPPGPSEWDAILDDPRLRVVTLAPEQPRALDLISRLTQRGVIVSMGHTNATYDEARYGFEFGARHTTHTFNAMRGLHHREAGMLGYAMANDSVACELIYDRTHVSREAAGLLLKAKPESKVIGISDSSMATGIPAHQTFTMWGHEVETLAHRVVLAGTETLAGSVSTLFDVFRNLAEDFGMERAIRLCCENPRMALGITGMPRTFVELDARMEIVGRRELR